MLQVVGLNPVTDDIDHAHQRMGLVAPELDKADT